MKKYSLYLITLIFLLIFPLTALGEVFYIDTDNVGSPVAMWDAQGKKVWDAEYLPFGEEFTTTKSPRDNKNRFVGKGKDKETGLTYFGARYFDERSGRFLTPDPVRAVDPFTSRTNYELLENPQRLNRYAYGLNNPYRFVDPDGEFALPLITGAVGAAIGGIYNGANNWNELSGTKWWSSVGVGTASGFVAGATGIGGAVAGAGLNEIHEQTLRGKDITNYDSGSIATASAAGFTAGLAGTTLSGIAAEIPKGGLKNGLKFTEPSILKPIDLSGKTFKAAGQVSAVPVSSYVQDKTDKTLKKK